MAANGHASASLSVGVISDTHGLLRPSAARALHGCSLIVHAGDIGGPDLLEALAAIAPVAAVRGNVDLGAWAAPLPETRVVEAAGARLLVLHDLGRLGADPAAAGFAAVISGHSHRPSVDTREGVLYLNPGAAGPRRFRSPVTLARLTVTGGAVAAEIVDLEE